MLHWSHDIRDPEAFVAAIISRSSRDLDYHQRERLHQFLLIALWEISREYRPGGISLSTLAGYTLPKRIIDWERSPEEGGRTKWQFADRTYERPRVYVDSLDRVGGPEPSGTVDGPESGDPDFARVFGAGDSTRSRQEDGMGKGSSRKAA